MKKFVLLSVIVFVYSHPAMADTTSVPLKDIWAYEMPDTQNIRKLIPPKQRDLAELIQVSLGRNSSDQIKQGFVVQGEAREVLQKAYDVLVSGKAADKKIKANRKSWVVFFTHDSMQYVYLHEVKRDGKKITVRYRFVPHDSKEMTRHFAIIPLANLPAGQYRVSMSNSPMEQRYIDVGYRPIPESYVSKIVCESFEFAVAEKPDD